MLAKQCYPFGLFNSNPLVLGIRVLKVKRAQSPCVFGPTQRSIRQSGDPQDHLKNFSDQTKAIEWSRVLSPR